MFVKAYGRLIEKDYGTKNETGDRVSSEISNSDPLVRFLTQRQRR